MSTVPVKPATKPAPQIASPSPEKAPAVETPAVTPTAPVEAPQKGSGGDSGPTIDPIADLKAKFDDLTYTTWKRLDAQDTYLSAQTGDLLKMVSRPTPIVTFRVAATRKASMSVSPAKIPLKEPTCDGNGITLYWNPRPAANGNSGDPTSLQIGASNAPRRLYTGYSVTIPTGWRGVVTSVPKHGMPVRPIAILEAGDHDEDLALPISYTTDTGGNVQIGTQAAIGVLTLIPAHSVECKVE